MILHKRGYAYVVESTYDERAIVKALGFWWHPGPAKCNRRPCSECDLGIGATWWTGKPDLAVQLIAVADDEARQALAPTQQTVEASRADDSDIEIPKPEGCEFFGYQKAGVAYALQRRYTLIGDEMGLGKTCQSLGIVNATPEIKTVLVVCPASLRINWFREARKWLTRPFNFHVVDRTAEIPSWATFVIVNYDKLISEPVRDSILRREWDLLVADEMHKCKNPKAKRTKALYGYNCDDCKGSGKVNETRPDPYTSGAVVPIRGKYVTCTTCEGRGLESPGLIQKSGIGAFLTGTPILNRPGELFPFLHAAYPTEFPNWWAFRKRFCAGLDDGASNLDQLQARLRALCMVRRLKADVLKDLPPKTRSIVLLAKDDFEGVLEAEAKALANVAEAQEALDAMQAAKQAEGEAAGKDSESYQVAVAKLREIHIPFEEISLVRHATALAKVPAVIEYVDGLLEGVDKVLVFAHHRDVLAGLAAPYKTAAVLCDGETPMADRQKAVDRFQADPTCKVMVASISAMGVGWTMTAATHVVFGELDWVPANVTQAEDRLHRIGQLGNVTVHHLVIDDSIDAKMAKTIVRKQEVADKALDRASELKIEATAPKSAAPVPVVTAPAASVNGPAPSVNGTVHAPAAPAAPLVTEEVRKAAHKAMQILAGTCDGARSWDGAGFSKFDAEFGRKLAEWTRLTDKMALAAVRLARKYRRQLTGSGLLQVLGIEVETPKKRARREAVAEAVA